MKYPMILIAALGLAACGGSDESDAGHSDDAAPAAQQMPDPTDPTTLPAGAYPMPPEPNYGPEAGSIMFEDTDPGPTIGGILSMRPAVDESGERVDERAEGITMYMIHWGLEVGEPGTEDDAGNGDMGGDCKGFRDTGHVVMKPIDEVGFEARWLIPEGTVVPDKAVYFVGHTLYGKIHNLPKCTQTPIVNWIEG